MAIYTHPPTPTLSHTSGLSVTGAQELCRITRASDVTPPPPSSSLHSFGPHFPIIKFTTCLSQNRVMFSCTGKETTPKSAGCVAVTNPWVDCGQLGSTFFIKCLLVKQHAAPANSADPLTTEASVHARSQNPDIICPFFFQWQPHLSLISTGWKSVCFKLEPAPPPPRHCRPTFRRAVEQ